MVRSKDYINREISWLSFNERVLQEAMDTSVPLLERLKFLGIFSSNQDEFFSVRVGTLQRMLDAGVKSKAMVGGSPKKVMGEVHDTVIRLRDKFDTVFRQIARELESYNVFIVDETELTDEQQAFLKAYFNEKIRHRLVPIMIKDLPEFPYLRNQAIYLAVAMYRYSEPQQFNYALIEVPTDVLARFIILPECDRGTCIIMLEDVIRFGLSGIFSTFQYDSIKAYTIKLTRDAEMDFADDVTKSFFEKVSESLKAREKGEPVRFVHDREMPEDLLDFILDKLHLAGFENIVPGGRYHNARDFMNFPAVGPETLRTQKDTPLPHRNLIRHKSMLNAIKEKDILLHYPYQSFGYHIDLLREAAIDPNVISIKTTLYRVAKYSNVGNALINAVKNGKEVTVVIELQARFDEELNMYWTRKLEEAGARIIDGVPSLKVHSKLCHITRKEGDELVHYSCIGTGNFNEDTARIYCDHTLMTANKDLTNEVEHLFDFFKCNYKKFLYKHLLVSPMHMRRKLLAMINNERKNAMTGKPAYIYAKMNSLVDVRMIGKLYDASKEGVKIKLIIRGICSLVPGVEGLSENIEVISIVDKYLEHSRVFIFCNGGEEKYYLSSADWMARNLDRRIEVTAPIYDRELQQELRDYMEIQFRDNTKARIINESQDNKYRKGDENELHRAQVDIYRYLEGKLRGAEGSR
ncbi:MAG: polyphosphate kinase 1 [Methanolobus sp.]|uniref:polyphosphate kinase 1 n=1 Tax=Methanolobus sp. TaxID=1874737 RepID=UPI00272F82B1|nr:polyphosphate kinase 1 [Methanolobus sp.]MDP2216318.1 polyphosphate kinase 1 [Methanolobus sp.]